MYLDRHDLPGMSPEELAAAHELDLAAQADHGVRYHSYWFDPNNGSVFCLAEGPNQAAVEAVHRQAHGVMAGTVIELNMNAPLNELFGSIPSHAPGTAYSAPAMRAIVFTDVCDSVAQTHALGDEGHLQLLREHDTLVRAALAEHGGREVKHTGDGIMAAFTSTASAVAFAIEVQRRLAERNTTADTGLHVSIGISAGEPVTNANDDLFGAAVQLAARLCDAADRGEIAVSVVVKELCIGKPLRFVDRGQLPLKGVPEPTQIYAVAWQA
jgi:class 3 adenylate cyclase